MKALVVYESMFGNTEVVAKAIADGLSLHMEVDAVEVGKAPTTVPMDVELLVIGGPTHQFGMSRESSREQATKETSKPLVSSSVGIREWLQAIPKGESDIPAAAFCTVLEKPRFVRYFGTAGRKIDKRLRRLGFRIMSPPENFWVGGMTGPLLDGEEERARQWGEEVASRLVKSALVAH